MEAQLTISKHRSFASCNCDISDVPVRLRSFASCNRDISASLHVFTPLHPATVILVHPCTSAKDSPFALILITSHNDQYGRTQRRTLRRPTD